jgi:inositol hexakisphosphate/diphosphoinositol-pentakisphosphate kinase
MEQLSRTVSSESTRSSQLLGSGDGTPLTNRKARSSESETAVGNVERSSVSMPPPASKAVPRQFPLRRLSKASDSGILDFLGAARNGTAVEETDNATPTLESARAGYPSTLTLPDAHRPTRSETDVDSTSNRMSFSSLYSIGSAIYSANTRAMSGPGSIAGSELEGESLAKVRCVILGESGLTVTERKAQHQAPRRQPRPSQ